MTIQIATTRYLKDSTSSYDEQVINIAKQINANFILLSFTGTAGERERWNWRLIPDFVKKCHRDGIKVSFYMKATNIMWKPMFQERIESRDWIMVYKDGTPALYGGQSERFMGCLNNPGWRSYLKEMIEKAIPYDPDALFYDNCFIPKKDKEGKEEGAGEAWACYCNHCREQFRGYTRETLGWPCELPIDSDWADPVWQAFIKFRDKTLVDVFAMITEFAHQLKPEIIVYPNLCVPWQSGGGAKGSATNQIAKVVDLVLFEKRSVTTAVLPPEGGLPRPGTSAVDWQYGAALGRGPIWYRLNGPDGAYSTRQIKVGIAEASAFNGANHWIMAQELACEKEKADAIGGYYRFLEQNEALYSSVESVADVAVFISTPTINWYLPDRSARGSGLPHSIPGFGQALAELHVPFKVVLDEDPAKLECCRAVVIPNAACMSSRQIERIVEYVDRGGGLVATGVTSLYDECYRTRGDYGLSRVFGVHHGELAAPVVKRRFGKGFCAYMRGTPEEDFWKGGSPWGFQEIREALNYVLGDDRQIRVDAPSTTVINLTENLRSAITLLHLINFEASMRVKDISVTIRKPVGRTLERATLLSPDLPSPDFGGSVLIETNENTETVCFTIPRLDTYDVVVMNWAIP